MKKLINDVETVLAESLDGFAAAHADIVTLGAERQFVRRRNVKPGKVALISGGGSGHEPLHAGFVGMGMLDAACPGQVFTSPTPDQMLAAAQSVEAGAGVLFIVKNYSGDMMNFEMAAEMLDRENATVIVNDDVAVENSTYTTGRRGVAGTLIVEKIVGAAAERGSKLAELKSLGDAVNKATASMGVALTSCTVPAAGKPTFQIGIDEMEMGVGIHGEPGRRRVKHTTADEIAEELTGSILKDLSLKPGQEVILLVNGFGGTPLLELYVMVHAARKVLAGAGVKVARFLTGSYVTSLEMAGCSITVSAADSATLALWDAPVHTAALRWGV
ncbi:MAG TPA: dihydroxyacetone kinase subunit DhaK [Piscinibacter sp.]|uniref:dihydroxyacetone kinase subunit DhaK n=1 Tax=Piscinibacter sp. TaxID=1903157 RepID=UPI001DA09EF5|nr:dihydroxyacetone kinase subunit DhaK [Piscinibacter sp.]MBK7531852.1 dihydroxyacetone kinase subunit DhaK [Piscinibacter sp.]MBL0092067.1 dihydroxyacetone kinase subunit DhaK [Piscinibacter sp.]HNW62295.1 dihydroxyacetone kinase subunit DhaK [Piscinibacter sp.]HOY34277.1 dihydroxyacetone kinase subunit DhaK [Piscinibacter sp.]HPG77677.1 dihydroxyacetone kinase subunit DhaK [Piscinibacter sp.]